MLENSLSKQTAVTEDLHDSYSLCQKGKKNEVLMRC